VGQTKFDGEAKGEESGGVISSSSLLRFVAEFGVRVLKVNRTGKKGLCSQRARRVEESIAALAQRLAQGYSIFVNRLHELFDRDRQSVCVIDKSWFRWLYFGLLPILRGIQRAQADLHAR
jgi:hypothetical protein